MYDLMIIGGGPAGLAAGVYAARKRLKTLLVSVDIGGQGNKTQGIDKYLGSVAFSHLSLAPGDLV